VPRRGLPAAATRQRRKKATRSTIDGSGGSGKVLDDTQREQARSMRSAAREGVEALGSSGLAGRRRRRRDGLLTCISHARCTECTVVATDIDGAVLRAVFQRLAAGRLEDVSSGGRGRERPARGGAYDAISSPRSITTSTDPWAAQGGDGGAQPAAGS